MNNRYNNFRGHGGGGFGFRGGNKQFRGGPNFRGTRPLPSWEHGTGRDGYGPNKRFQNKPFVQHGNRNPNQQWKNKNTKKDTPGKRLSETDIGVTKYLCDHAGFNGVIKYRYSDFQVSEISESGEVAKLTNVTPPEPPKDEINEDEDLLISKYNLELLPIETWDKINTLAVSKQPTNEVVQVDVTGMTKEHRTKIHDAVKKAFAESIVGSTVTIEDKKFVKFEKYRSGKKIDTRVKWMWPGEYVHFIVYKENCDTMEAASHIAERLKLSFIKPSMMGYAGTKDRRAKSSQWFSLRRVEPSRIANACRDLRELKAGNFKFSDKHLKLGTLKGNRFRIALRNVTAEDDVVYKACEDLRDNGFINYYGLQRFGTRPDTPTYAIGLKLLQGNFKEAINAILEVREGPMEFALLEFKNTGNAAMACRYLKKYQLLTTTEGKLLKALSQDPNDLIGCVNKVPRNTRLLYLHSYQSFIWNNCVSERLQRFGHTPAVGDLVLEHSVGYPLDEDEGQNEDSEDEENLEGLEENNASDKELDDVKTDIKEEINNEATNQEDDQAEDIQMPTKLPQKHILRAKIPVKVLNEEDVASGNYTLLDIILPLPGFEVEYPPNMLDYYEKMLKADNVTLNMKHRIRSYNMAGAYRHIIIRPTDMEWQCVKYDNPYGDLILSDADELNNTELDSIVPDGKYKALLLTMNLPASCYATMALRELLKVNTSGDFQASQNDYHKKVEATKGTESENNGEAEKRKLDDSNDELEVKKAKIEEVAEVGTVEGEDDEIIEVKVPPECIDISEDN